MVSVDIYCTNLVISLAKKVFLFEKCKSKEFFDYCLTHIEEQDKKRILLVGDSLTSDIKGGVLAGIPTCWYRPEGTKNPTEYKPDYEISDLHQILEILT